jgi:hypothetical protein
MRSVPDSKALTQATILKQQSETFATSQSKALQVMTSSPWVQLPQLLQPVAELALVSP